ncbi:MAG: hypothetical protein H3C34_14655 [Caldilineaceae bacterium]|nr:hypothetical protein [Caldilineaceae bacterium]
MHWPGEHLPTLLADTLRLVAAHEGRTHICTGYTANLDLIVSLDTATIATLIASVDAARLQQKIEHPAYVIREPADLWAGLWIQLRDQKGGEWPLEDAATYRWLREYLPGRPGVGGTGIQAACALARLGLRPLLNVPWRDRELLDLLPENVLITAGGQVLPATHGQARDPEHQTTVHFILEYARGTTWRLAGQETTATRTDRFIVPFDPEEREFHIDATFRAASLALPGPKWLLASGFNIPNRSARVFRAIEEAAAHMQAFRRDPTAQVHLELGELHQPEIRQRIRDRLFGLATSVGFNEHELGVLAGDLGRPKPALDHLPDVVGFCRHVAEVYGLARLNVHTSTYTLALTRFDPEVEQRALLLGCATAAFRAWQGDFAPRAQIAAQIAGLPFHPEGVEAGQALTSTSGLPQSGSSGLRAVLTPAFLCPQQRQAVGLGDTYTAGVLAAFACQAAP